MPCMWKVWNLFRMLKFVRTAPSSVGRPVTPTVDNNQYIHQRSPSTAKKEAQKALLNNANRPEEVSTMQGAASFSTIDI